jgi:dUTPase
MTASRLFPVLRRLAGPVTVAAAIAAIGLAPSPARAQQADHGQAADTSAAVSGQPSQGGALDYRREVFHFPSGLRNPFAPVKAGQALGPRFEDLDLTGVIYNQTLGSVAVLLDKTTGKRYRVHEGERVGQARVQQIRPGEVSFVVSGFGQNRTEVLRVKKQDKETSG